MTFCRIRKIEHFRGLIAVILAQILTHDPGVIGYNL